MSERAAARLGSVLYLLIVALVVTGAVVQFQTRHVNVRLPFAFRGSDIPMWLVIGTMGALVATRRPRNPIGWLLIAGALIGALGYVGVGYATVSFANHGGTWPGTNPIAWAQNWVWVPMAGLVVVYAIALFPDGAAQSIAWKRFLTFFAPVALAVFTVAIAFTPGQLQGLPASFDNPYGISKSASNALSATGGLLFMFVLAAPVVSTVRRYRRSSGVAREQMKWLVLAGAAIALSLVFGLPAYLFTNGTPTGWVQVAGILILTSILLIPISMGIAILRHRLWNIDVVINKAVVFAALAVAITAVYVVIAIAIPLAIIGRGGSSNPAISIVATAIIALIFQPLLAGARRLANRLVYGKRATPHDVLSVLGERMAEAYSLDDVLPRIAQLVTEATAASTAEVWLRIGDELRPSAAYPASSSDASAIPISEDGSAVPAVPGAQHSFPVRHQAELLGLIAVKTPANEQLTSTDERLLTDLAGAAGLVLRNLRLIEELRASRQRLVSAQDAERRKIERNLHDGAQQHLVALSINLGLARSMVDGDPAQVREILDQLKSDAGDALENLRDLARGIYPPLLADRGLAAALTSHAAKAPVPTTVDAGEVKRYPMEVEAAIYFCVLEALQNVAKYAHASSAVVRVGEENGHLVFAVTDDGAGFDVARAARGAGLTNMTDRLEALGGRLEVSSRPGTGTTISGRVASTPA